MANFAKVGDKVICRRIDRRFGEEHELVVVKVGRKWGVARPADQTWPEIKFDLQTGYEDGRGFPSAHRVLTSEMDALERRRADVLEKMRALGLRFEYQSSSDRFSVESLERVVATLSTSTGGTENR